MQWKELAEHTQREKEQPESSRLNHAPGGFDAGTPHVYRNYKDRVFRRLFNNKSRLLELYNALNGSNYTDADGLTINTLENAVYMKMKNDVSFRGLKNRSHIFVIPVSFSVNLSVFIIWA